MKTAGSCGGINGAERSNAPMSGSVSSAAYWFVTNICLPFTWPFSSWVLLDPAAEMVFLTRPRTNRSQRTLGQHSINLSGFK